MLPSWESGSGISTRATELAWPGTMVIACTEKVFPKIANRPSEASLERPIAKKLLKNQFNV
jgi:hypothetical protein